MEIYFYKILGDPKHWYTNYNGVVLAEWCLEHSIKYKQDYFDGFKTGIILLDEKDEIYFHLRWGGEAKPYTDYID